MRLAWAPRSFATRLMLVVVLASAVAVTLACGLLVPLHYHSARSLALDDLATLGDVLSIHSTAALAFGDPETGQETLLALRAVPEISAAALFDADGQPFAAYRTPGSGAPALRPQSARTEQGGWLIHVEPVVQGEEHLGTLVLAYDTRPIAARLWRDVMIAVAAAAASTVVAGLLALRLQRGLARPVRELGRTATAVADAHDYTVRARHFDDDELGRLTDTFNGMLDRIEQQSREIQRSNQELKARNQEMEQFVYTVSHDLKSPLVTITGFVGLLQEDVRQGNTEGMLDAAGHLARASAKMGELIDDLLSLSRIGRVPNDYQSVDVNELLVELIEDLQPQLEAANTRVEVQPRLPRAWGDRVRLSQIFDNLINNALKYGCPTDAGPERLPGGEGPDGSDPEQVDTAPCRIIIGGETVGDETRYFVRDFGPGVPPQYQERIWGLFQRLDSRTEGTGVGLAIVARIADVHGGRAWLDSAPGRGATFWFALPTEQPEIRDQRPEVRERRSEVRSHRDQKVRSRRSASGP